VFETRKRGKARRETNEGNRLRSCKISGSVRSGDVHTRMYSPSASPSSLSDCKRLVTSSLKAVIGLDGSSKSPTAPVAEDKFDDVVVADRKGAGVSRNGSLGARARLE
jgi:hypothetical protein